MMDNIIGKKYIPVNKKTDGTYFFQCHSEYVNVTIQNKYKKYLSSYQNDDLVYVTPVGISIFNNEKTIEAKPHKKSDCIKHLKEEIKEFKKALYKLEKNHKSWCAHRHSEIENEKKRVKNDEIQLKMLSHQLSSDKNYLLKLEKSLVKAETDYLEHKNSLMQLLQEAENKLKKLNEK